jgi:hypothetical protein
MREQWYLCRVPWNGFVILLHEKDYSYQRYHEASLRVPDPKNKVVLLAQGSKEDMMMLKECFKGDLTNVS